MSNPKTITLLPFGGLGNRMRVMNSGFYLNKKLGYDCRLLWFEKWELNCPIDELFSSVGFSYKAVPDWKKKLLQPILKHIFILKYPKLYKWALSFFYDKVYFDNDWEGSSPANLLNEIKSHKHILFATCYSFYDFPDFNNFKLTDGLQTRVKTVTSSFNENVIGVHIRRTDHIELIRAFPLENFITAIKKQISASPSLRFFLATDDHEVKRLLQHEFESQIITQEISLNRDSDEGIKGAIVDIYCLAATRKILCSTKSSFATTAALIGPRKELIEVG